MRLVTLSLLLSLACTIRLFSQAITVTSPPTQITVGGQELTISVVSAITIAPAFKISPAAKGPNQINLTWSAQPGSYYGYVIEAQSAGDSRYTSWTELRPIPDATGYTCDPTVNWHGAGTGCTISDPAGVHVYNPTVHGVPFWVTEPQYLDPQDGTPAQFIAAGLKNNTTYNFRVRTYTGNTTPTYGAYSVPALATTANYTQRYVSPTGNDSNDGTASDDAHAWRTIGMARAVPCGTELIVMGGSYANEYFGMTQSCTPASKVVLMANIGDSATITSNLHPDWGPVIAAYGANIVVDGLTVALNNDVDFVVALAGTRNAFLNLKVGPTSIPSNYGGVKVTGSFGLLYGSYIHDFGSPAAAQNPAGNGGYIMTVEGANNVFWSNHFTRGGHDTSMCHNGCTNNRWLNDIMDGGWGMAFETVYSPASGTLFEGLIVRDPGALEANIYKPGFEFSFSSNVLRRSIFAGTTSGAIGKAIEVNAYDSAVNNLIYNNVFYNVQKCYFQSHDKGTAAYNGTRVQNNICTFNGDLSEIYLPNLTPGAISNNYFRQAGGSGAEAVVIWNQDSNVQPYVTLQTLAYAEANYVPAWQNNAAISLLPLAFADPANMDFHLAPSSPLRGVGAAVTDAIWGFPAASRIDLGPYSPK